MNELGVVLMVGMFLVDVMHLDDDFTFIHLYFTPYAHKPMKAIGERSRVKRPLVQL